MNINIVILLLLGFMLSGQMLAQPRQLQPADRSISSTFPNRAPEIDLVRLKRKITYPSWAAQTGIEGQMGIKALVDAKGRILQCKMTNSLHPEMDEQVMAILGKMQARPAEHHGNPIASWAYLRIRFTLFP